MLVFPGEGRQGDGVSSLVEGVIQTEATSEDIGKFCWVKRSGITACFVSPAGTTIAAGGIVVPAAEGKVEGHETSARGIGWALTTVAEVMDGLAWVNLDIPDGPLSYAYANTQNSYNQVTIR